MNDDAENRVIKDNPAAELHHLFTKWSTANATAPNNDLSAQRLRNPGPSMPSMRKAVRLLESCMFWLDQAKRDDPELESFDRYINVWAQAIFAYPGGWRGPGGAGPFTVDMMAALRQLGALMRAHGLRLPVDQRSAALDLLREIEQQTEDDPELPEDLREFLRATTQELRRVYADYSRTGLFDFNLARKGLKIALDLAAERSGERRSTWERFSNRWTQPVAVNALGGIATQGGMLAIGTGLA